MNKFWKFIQCITEIFWYVAAIIGFFWMFGKLWDKNFHL